MTTKLQHLEKVVELACLTEDRSNDEQRALLTVARQVDTEMNVLTSANVAPEADSGAMWYEVRVDGSITGWRRHRPESRLERLADVTRVLDEDQRRVRLPARGKRADAYAGRNFVPWAER